MDINAAMEYIDRKNKLGIVPGLDNVRELLRRLDNPQDKCKALHISGTNGKGSIFAFVESALIEAGFTVGRYISPTIFEYLERFQINKKNMDEDTFCRLLEQVADVIEKMEKDGYPSPTAFEIETAIAFLYFAEKKCDYTLIECGMGGTLDATNVIKNKLISVIAQISIDHTAFLGDTIEQIAVHKAGIIKEDSVCVSAPQMEEAVRVLKTVCAEKNSEFVMVDETDFHIEKDETDGIFFSYKGEEYDIGLIGAHQIINASTAIEVLKILNIDYEFIKEGLHKTEWKGRLTKVNDRPLMYVDGAHNEAAWIYLKNNINKYFTNKKIIYIIGVLKDKEYEKMIDILCDNMSYAITITPDTPRALDNYKLAELISNKGIKAETADTYEDAVRMAFDAAGDEDVIMVCGSLSFISDYLK
ncbi:MAG: bifunctional folylpolyglutamate synthase/dihydrofolate synthase [Lachnospiraceae bacterium]|nr:bifunctional folylpolyglutamate synthase/dihydrofolate synthase [Lachnospiraceae bacterium]